MDKLALPFLLWPALTLAQSPAPSARAPINLADASLGYSYVNASISPPNRVGLNGLDANATIDIPARFGIKLDLGYTRAPNAFGTDHHADMLTYLAGPVVYPVAREKLGTYAHFLVGGARTTGPVPTGGGGYFTAYANQFAWALGGGVEYQLRPRISARIGADYLHTAYFDPAQQLRGRSNARIVVGVVYSFGRQR